MNAKERIIAANIDKILNNSDYRNEMIKNLEEVKQKLHMSAAAHKVAQIVVNDI